MNGGREYDTTISTMKGIAIIGVVVGHCVLSSWIENFVNQWHLATFFFVAGIYRVIKKDVEETNNMYGNISKGMS